jgi:phosphate-selective porin OprO/OprP
MSLSPWHSKAKRDKRFIHRFLVKRVRRRSWWPTTDNPFRIKEEKMRKKFLCVVVSLVMGLFLLTSANTARAESSTKLIDLLIKKGILTKEEAEALKKEAMEEEKQQQVGAGSEQLRETEKQSAEWTKNIEVGYKNGVYIKSTDDRFSLKMNVGVQPEFIYQAREGQDDQTTFKIRRARYFASGNAFYPWLKYGTQLTLEGGSSALRDAYLEATYLDYLRPKAGQFKVPFDREFLDSGFSLPFVERSIASSQFSLQRDTGFQLSGAVLGNQVAYAVGVFNGSGANQNNSNTDYMYVGRLVWEPFGPYPYAQPPLGNKKNQLFALGVAGAYLPDLDPGERKSLAGVLGNTNIVPVTSDVFEFTSDLAFKYDGFSMEAGYYFRRIDPQKSTVIYPSTDAWGVYAQAGYFILPDKLELAARYSYIDPDNPTKKGINREHEATFGLNYYFYGQRIKAQLDYSYFRTEGPPSDKTDHVIQSTMIFLF